MTVTFKECTSNPKTAVKSFNPAEGKTIVKNNVQPFERLDDLTGNLILEYDPDIERLNYCEFDDGMKYFITGKARDIGNRLILTLRLDALSTYWSSIQECNAMVNTTTDSNGWTEMIQGDRLLYAYGINHATQTGKRPSIDYDPGHFYMAIYG